MLSIRRPEGEKQPASGSNHNGRARHKEYRKETKCSPPQLGHEVPRM